LSFISAAPGVTLGNANARKILLKENRDMKSNNSTMVPEAKEAMNRFKMESASEVGVQLKQGYNGDLTSRQAGSIGGQMVKKMIESYEKSMK
jgi:hypothetical protein